MGASLMKGHVWHERKDAQNRKGNPVVVYPVDVEDKHDEIRCHVKVSNIDQQCSEFASVAFLSYSGKPLANMERFTDLFIALASSTGYTEFDLGFECNGNFNDSYRWVRSTKGIPEDLVNTTHKFYVFGLPGYDDTLLSQYNRRCDVVTAHQPRDGTVVLMPRITRCVDEATVDAAFLDARSRGLEGVMVKQPKHLYQRKRTDGWLKMKPEAEADGVITELHEAVCGKDQPELGLVAGQLLGRVGSVTVRMPDGSEASPHGIAHGLGNAMFKHPEQYIGQWCEFKYMERDRQGGYRHPTFHRIREEK